jgi:hypothetical protein
VLTTRRTGVTFSIDTTLRIVRVRRNVPVLRTGKVVVPVNVVDSRLVERVVTVERTERTLATFSVGITFKVVRIRRNVPVVRTGKVVVPVDVYLVGSS